jgi:hypothetical protein
MKELFSSMWIAFDLLSLSVYSDGEIGDLKWLR